jgi:raffinose/stachyose/melibiose transport system substrate-binding protein
MANWWRVASLILVLVMITACGETHSMQDIKNETTNTLPQAQKVKILLLSLSDSDVRNEIREEYIKVNLEKEMPDVEVEYDLGGGGQDYASKIKVYNSSGSMPDVWFSEQNLSTVVITAGNALDLTPYIRKSGFDKKFTSKELMEPDKNGKIYCVQSGNDKYITPRLWYHKDIFQKNKIQVPKTFDELLKVCEALNKKGIVPISIIGKDGWTLNLHLLQTMIMAEDPQVVFDLLDNKTDFTDPVIKNALERIQKLARVGAFPTNVSNIDYGPAIKMYTSGKAAMLAMFSWELPNLEKSSPDTDFMLWPTVKKGLDPKAAIQYWGAPLSGYMVSVKTKNPEVAARFAMYCAGQDALYYNIESKSPTVLDTGVKMEDISVLAKKDIKQLNAAKVKVPSIWSVAFNTRISAEIATQNSKLLTGRYSPNDYIKVINPLWIENIKK